MSKNNNSIGQITSVSFSDYNRDHYQSTEFPRTPLMTPSEKAAAITKLYTTAINSTCRYGNNPSA